MNKSRQSFTGMKSWVSPRVRTNQSKHYLMTLTIFWYSDAVARSDEFGLPWLLMFVPPRSENKLQLISVAFPKNLVSRGIPVWIDIMDRWFSTSWGLFCFDSMQMSSLMDTKFSCFFEISFLAVNLNDAVSNTILLETSHEDVWH